MELPLPGHRRIHRHEVPLLATFFRQLTKGSAGIGDESQREEQRVVALRRRSILGSECLQHVTVRAYAWRWQPSRRGFSRISDSALWPLNGPWLFTIAVNIPMQQHSKNSLCRLA